MIQVANSQKPVPPVTPDRILAPARTSEGPNFGGAPTYRGSWGSLATRSDIWRECQLEMSALYCPSVSCQLYNATGSGLEALLKRQRTARNLLRPPEAAGWLRADATQVVKKTNSRQLIGLAFERAAQIVLTFVFLRVVSHANSCDNYLLGSRGGNHKGTMLVQSRGGLIFHKPQSESSLTKMLVCQNQIGYVTGFTSRITSKNDLESTCFECWNKARKKIRGISEKVNYVRKQPTADKKKQKKKRALQSNHQQSFGDRNLVLRGLCDISSINTAHEHNPGALLIPAGAMSVPSGS